MFDYELWTRIKSLLKKVIETENEYLYIY
jgi:hypothetical protein